MGNDRVLSPSEIADLLEQRPYPLIRYVGSVAGSRGFSEPTSLREVIQRLRVVAALYDEEGNIDASKENAERFALCLEKEGFHQNAKEFYDSITASGLQAIPEHRYRVYMPVADQSSILGFQGLMSYARVSLHTKDNGRAKEVLEHLKDANPGFGPSGFRDVRHEAIRVLVKDFNDPYNTELSSAQNLVF